MHAIIKNLRNSRLKVHLSTESGRPLCGGGHLARSATAWQTDLGEANCQKCLSIQARKSATFNPPPATHAPV